MNNILKGKKLQMTQVFMDNGRVVPVTVVALDSAEMVTQAENFLNMPIEITGKSKGKGFAGGIKKWGFRRQPATRGASNKVRSIGSIGAQTPSKVFKGKKMPGNLGNERVTVKGLKIVSIDSKTNQIMVSGPIPGARNSEIFLKIKKSLDKETL